MFKQARLCDRLLSVVYLLIRRALQMPGECAVVVTITNSNSKTVYLDNCLVKWTKEEWWQPRFVTISVRSDFVDRGEQKVILTTNLPVTNAPYYSDANAIDIILITSSKPSRTCQGVGDPHYTTFDRKYWHQYEAGQLVFYGRNSNTAAGGRIFEAQTKVHLYPARHCGLAVRENNGLVVVDMCPGSHKTKVVGTGVSLSISGSRYIVSFPP